MRKQAESILKDCGLLSKYKSKLDEFENQPAPVFRYKNMLKWLYLTVYGEDAPNFTDTRTTLNKDYNTKFCSMAELSSDDKPETSNDDSSEELQTTKKSVNNTNSAHKLSRKENKSTSSAKQIAKKFETSNKKSTKTTTKKAIESSSSNASLSKTSTTNSRSKPAQRAGLHRKTVDGLDMKLGVRSSSDPNRIIKFQINKGALTAQFPLHSYIDIRDFINDSIIIGSFDTEDRLVKSTRGARVDIDHMWIQFSTNDAHSISTSADIYYIPYSYPIIPECQCDITVTTPLKLLKDNDYLKLIPNLIYRSRHPLMFNNKYMFNIDIDPDIGWIPKIEGCTQEEVIDNILKYPTIDFLQRDVDENNYVPFSSYFEFNNELSEATLDRMQELIPLESNSDEYELFVQMGRIPFYQEYICRKYLIERDRGESHISDCVGDVQPFMEVNMPYDMYIFICDKYNLNTMRDIPNELSLIKIGMKHRQEYLRSINPVIKEANRAGVSIPD